MRPTFAPPSRSVRRRVVCLRNRDDQRPPPGNISSNRIVSLFMMLGFAASVFVLVLLLVLDLSAFDDENEDDEDEEFILLEPSHLSVQPFHFIHRIRIYRPFACRKASQPPNSVISRAPS